MLKIKQNVTDRYTMDLLVICGGYVNGIPFASLNEGSLIRNTTV